MTTDNWQPSEDDRQLLTAVLVPRFDGRAVYSKLAQREGLLPGRKRPATRSR